MPAALRDHLDAEAFARLMSGQGKMGARLAVAVSGGADSLALLRLLAGWAPGAGKTLTCLTVDHGLRAGARAEAERVAQCAARLGIAHRTLVWSGEKPRTGVQQAARRARYRLLHEYCLLEGIGDLFLAHHGEDQAETHLIRLLAQSGYEGLAGMPAVGHLGSLRLQRPLLSVRKDALTSYLRRAGVEWAEDPSNADRRFQRVRLRQAAPELARAGFSTEAAWAAAAAFGRLRAVSDRLVGRVMRDGVKIFPGGYAVVDQAALRAPGAVIGPRTLSRLLQALGGRAYPPSPDSVDRLWRRLPLDRGVTLSGCRLKPVIEGLLIWREPARVAPLKLQPGGAGFWDRRYEVVCAADAPPGLSLAPLGQAGVAEARAAAGGADPFFAIPGPVRAALPGLWGNGALLSTPLLGQENREKTAFGLRIRFIPPQ